MADANSLTRGVRSAAARGISAVQAISLILTVALIALLFAAPSPAQESQAQQPQVTADTERLLATLKDDGKREAFIRDLEALVAAHKARDVQTESSGGARLLERLSAKVETAGLGLAALSEKIAGLPTALSAASEYFADPDAREVWLQSAIQVVIILILGVAAQALVRRLLRRFHRSIESQSGEGLWLMLALGLLRAFLDLIALAAFVATAYATMSVLTPLHAGKVLALALINASLLAQVVLIIAKMLLAPDVSVMRLLPMGDEGANYVLLWVRRLVYVVAYGYFLSEVLLVLGASDIVHASISKLLGLAIVLMLVVLILQNRVDVAARIRGASQHLVGQLRRRAAEIWHLVAMLYVLVIYGVWLFDVPGGFEYVLRASGVSLAIVVLAAMLVVVLRRGLGKAFALSEVQKSRFPGLEARASRYLPILVGGFKLVIYASALLAVLRIWGIDTFAWVATPLGSSLIKGAVNVVVVVLIALLVWEVISAAIERYLAMPDSEGNVIDRGQRAMTLLPLLRNIVMVALAVLVTLTALSEIGVNIGPLIAGAGILGLAIGFGAQTFVKDVITGFFILIENAVAVGDIVILGGYKGKVEAISIRSIQLRDLQGDVHRIPFSEVSSTTNRSKVFSFASFDIGVAYREDIDHCMNVIRELGAEIRQDENFNAMILEDIEIMGVQSFDDSAVIIRARIKVQPGKQLGIQRAFNRLLKNRFDAEGIEIPFPHRTIYFGVDRDGAAPPAHLQIGENAAPAKRTKATLVKAPEGEGADFDADPKRDSGE